MDWPGLVLARRRSVSLMTHLKTPFSIREIVSHALWIWEMEKVNHSFMNDECQGTCADPIWIYIRIIVLCNTHTHSPRESNWDTIWFSRLGIDCAFALFFSPFSLPVFALKRLLFTFCAAIFAINPFVRPPKARNNAKIAHMLLTRQCHCRPRRRAESGNLALRIAYTFVCLFVVFQQQWQSGDC